jgi:S-methylmethionine-dependent homocysteine/selenocysteine methylase
MAKYRSRLPQLSEAPFLTDGGIETTLMFREGHDLPYFAAFDQLNHAPGYDALRNYFRTHAAIAREQGYGFILESATWRASPDWGQKLGYSTEMLVEANRRSIELLEEIRSQFEDESMHLVISGCLGPRGDGYDPSRKLTVDEAERYHAHQISTFRDTAADMVTAITMTHVEEAIGIARAADSAGMPAAISFTLETDGRLPTGQPLREAIEEVDRSTGGTVAYYMINCAHPTHFEHVLADEAPWIDRIRGIRANASKKSHAELDEAEELDEGNPAELGQDYTRLKRRIKNLNVLGGCCGTDDRHVRAIAKACAPLFGRSRKTGEP